MKSLIRSDKYHTLSIFAFLFSLFLMPHYVQGDNTPLHPATEVKSKSILRSDMRFDHPFKLDMSPNLAIIQDQDGFLWLSTQNGLVKYDGYTAQIYRPGPNSVSNGNIVSLIEDPTGSIWIGTQGGGVNRYDKQNNRFTFLRCDPKNTNSLGSDIIAYGPQSLLLDGDTLWIGTQDVGLDKYDIKTKTFTHFRHISSQSESIGSNTVWCIFKDSKGRLWIGNTAGLERFDSKRNTFLHYQHNPVNPQSIGPGWVYRILEDKNNPDILWLGIIGSGLTKFNTKTGVFTYYCHDPHSHDEITALCQDRNNRLLIGWYRVPAQGGLSMFDPATERFTDYLPKPNNPASLSTTRIFSIFQDRSGIIWLANADGSIDKCDIAEQNFRLYRHDAQKPTSISENSNLSYFEDSTGAIWFGGLSSGLNKYNRNTDTFASYPHNPQDPRSIRNNFVSRIFEDSSKTFWVATRGGALSIFDRTTGKCIRHYQHDPANSRSIPENDSIRYIIEDKDNPDIFWMGAFLGGFFKFDKRNEIFTSYKVNPADPSSLNSNSVFHLYQDADGIIWIATLGGGLNRFDKTTGKFSHFIFDSKDSASLGSNHILEIQELTPGYLWIATAGGGLEKFDKRKHTFQRFDKTHGFPANTVVSIRRDNDGNLWLGTDEGLVKFNPETGKTKVYKKSDGLQGDIYLESDALFTHDGQMWFGGVNGVNSFFPDRIKDNPYVPPVVLTSLKQGGEEIKIGKALTQLKKINLDWQHNFFEFEFAALNFTLPEKNQYAYKLEGFDKNWYYAGTRRFGRYSGLPPGRYTLRIKGSNNDGIWNEQGVSLQIVVTPPFWRSWWFLGLAALLVISLVLLWMRHIELQKHHLEDQVFERTRELKEAKEAAETANETKNVFLAKISHELRTPLNGILGYAQILLCKKTDAEIASGLKIIQNSGEHLLTLINDILDLSKIEAGKMEILPTLMNLQVFFETVSSIIQSRASTKDITFVTDTSSDIPIYVMADETRLRQVLLNLLGNAVKFTDQGQIGLSVKRLSNAQIDQVLLRFEVWDTGVGIASEHIETIFNSFEQVGDIQKRATGTGLGLAISRQLLQLMGSSLHMESQLGQGSRFWFELIFPISDQTKTEVQSPNAIIRGYTGPRRKVLVVDDYRTNRDMLSELLTSVGFEVFEAENGRRGIEKAREILPDLILMDRVMPEMDGLEAVRALRQIPELNRLPIIVVSAGVSNSEQSESLSQGFDDFLPKPFTLPQLTVLLEKHLGLEWKYETNGFHAGKTRGATEITPPPPEEIQVLYHLAMMGDIQAIKERSAVIASLGEEYKPFAVKLGRLAENFEEKQIMNLIRQSMEATKRA